MRLLHIITKLDVGGAQSVVYELALAQHAAGHDVSVVSGLSGPVADDLRSRGIDVSILDTLVHAVSPTRDRKTVNQLCELIRSSKPDIVHTHSSKGGLLGRIAARRCRVPSLYTAHGWPFQAGARRSQQVQSLVGEWVGGRLGDEVVCVTQAEEALAVKLHVGRKGHRHVIANGIAWQPSLERSVRSADEPFRVVMVARMSPPKRPDVLIEALTHTHDDVVLTIVGDGQLAGQVTEQVQRLGLVGRVKLVGLADPAPYLAQSHAFCLLSDYEGMPITVLEAMRAGLPIVANQLPGIAEAIAPNGGLLCALDPRAVAEALSTLHNEATRAYEMGQHSRGIWEDRYTAPLLAERYESLYRSLLKR